jgi:hypothetical protein
MQNSKGLHTICLGKLCASRLIPACQPCVSCTEPLAAISELQNFFKIELYVFKQSNIEIYSLFRFFFALNLLFHKHLVFLELLSKKQVRSPYLEHQLYYLMQLVQF